MNFALSEEQEFLREAARGTLSRVKTVEAAREALEGGTLPDLWSAAVEAGWPGLLVSEEHGGAGLGPMDAMLVFEELGRVLASVPLLGHLPATFLHEDATLADGSRRAAFVAAKPPSDIQPDWTTQVEIGGDGTVSGTASWVPDAPGADVFVVVGQGGRVAVVEDASVEAVTRYDATRSLGHVTFDGAAGQLVDVTPEKAANAHFLAWTLMAAEDLGLSDRCLEMGLEYARERFTFGRAIGSYQAVKHMLVEILRLKENARSLMFYAGYAGSDAPEEFPIAAAAFRLAAGKAADHATRTNISVHGGIGATWEHDAPLFFRRAQLSRRLLGGLRDAADRVAAETFKAAAA